MERAPRVVVTALVSHLVAALLKWAGGLVSGSAVLISEALHSSIDFTNQLLLFRNKAQNKPVAGHIYSYGKAAERYFLYVWSSIGLFSIGAGLGLAWAFYRFADLPVTGDVAISNWALLSLLVALLIQGYSFWVSSRAYWAQMRKDGASKPIAYLKDCKDIALVAITSQSLGGVLGLLLALIGLVTTMVTGNAFWDALAALLVALLMAAIAFQLGSLYMHHLTDVRDQEAERSLEQMLVTHPAVHQYQQIYSMVLTDNTTAVFADIELEQEAMVSGMLKTIATEKQKLLRQVPEPKQQNATAMAFVTARSMVDGPLKRSGLIVANIEQALREQLPQVSSVSIRIRGLGPFKVPEPKQRKQQGQQVEYLQPDQPS